MKKVWKKVFEPNKYIGFLLVNLSIVLLIYVFACHLEETWLAYVSYFLSTYALIVFASGFTKHAVLATKLLKKIVSFINGIIKKKIPSRNYFYFFL